MQDRNTPSSHNARRIWGACPYVIWEDILCQEIGRQEHLTRHQFAGRSETGTVNLPRQAKLTRPVVIHLSPHQSPDPLRPVKSMPDAGRQSKRPQSKKAKSWWT